jgi:hypothetical protein
VLQDGATCGGGLPIHLHQNKAGLIADLAILALFLLLLAVR